MLPSNCTVYGSKMLKFIKEQDGSILLGCLGIREPFSKIPLVSPILF